MSLMGSFRARLTALYLAFFSLLFVVFSIFLYGELSRSLVARLDGTLASEADTAAVLFPDELHEMHGDEAAAAREVVSELKVHGDFVAIREGSRVLACEPPGFAGAARPHRRADGRGRGTHLPHRGVGVARFHRQRAGRGPARHFHRACR